MNLDLRSDTFRIVVSSSREAQYYVPHAHVHLSVDLRRAVAIATLRPNFDEEVWPNYPRITTVPSFNLHAC